VYRQMPLNSIWEGAGNVMGLDVLRALHREPRCIDALEAELAPAHGAHAALDRFVEGLRADMRGEAADEASARVLAARIAIAVQGALLVRFAPSYVSDAFCASRLGGDVGGAFGMLPHGAPSADIVERAWPA